MAEPHKTTTKADNSATTAKFSMNKHVPLYPKLPDLKFKSEAPKLPLIVGEKKTNKGASSC
jgi:hypothetical protein